MVYYARKCTKQEVADVKAEKIPLLLGIILIILLAFLIVWQADMLGVSAGRLEQDARENQEIGSSWEWRRLSMTICAPCFSMMRRRMTVPIRFI